MSATTLSGLETQAYNDGKAFAQNQPGGFRVLLLDFGEAADVSTNVWGTCDFSTPCTLFSNPDILLALESASQGIHDYYVQGTTAIVYGTSNYHMTNRGMTDTDAYNVGYWQEKRANDLYNFEQNNGFGQQEAAAGSDTEPDYDLHVISNELVKGASAVSDVLYYDYGSADGCPTSGDSGSCDNGWSVVNVGFASYDGIAVPLPEIYSTLKASEWTVVRNNWVNSNGSYTFWGITSESGALNPQTAWSTLSSDNSGNVDTQPGIACFGC